MCVSLNVPVVVVVENKPPRTCDLETDSMR
jgi:hypothetical protein